MSFRHWSLTINNPTAADDELVSTAPQQYTWLKELIGQKEVGENGTEHYQLYLRTDKVRFSQIKSVFTRAHIEPGRNVAALKKYVQKDDTAIAGTRRTVRQALPTDIYAYVLGSYVHPTGYYKTMNYPKQFRTLDDVRYAHMCWLEYDRDFDYNGDTFAQKLLQAASRRMVQEGWFVEHIASNPMFKTAFKEHLHSIMYRQYGTQTIQAPEESQDDEASQDDFPNGDVYD